MNSLIKSKPNEMLDNDQEIMEEEVVFREASQTKKSAFRSSSQDKKSPSKFMKNDNTSSVLFKY
jgi:hypothetical protein